jgi:hypothetical protein
LRVLAPCPQHGHDHDHEIAGRASEKLDIQGAEWTVISFVLAGFFVDREFMRTWPAAGARYASA